jgi:signal transduction histidine kinase
VVKVLVIDDERPFLEIIKISLASEGYEVITAESAKEGLKIFEEQDPEVVLTDITLPDIDGLEVLRRIKAADDETEVIVITGRGDTDSAIASLQQGASDFVVKPIRDDAIMLALQRAEKQIAMNQRLRDYMENLEQKVQECTMDLRKAHEELIENERLGSIGETAAGLAHYMKNILTGLRGGTYMVEKGMVADNTPMLQGGWDMLQRNVDKVSSLVLELLRYSEETLLKRAACEPNQIIADVVELEAERARQNNIKLNMDPDPNLKEACLDRDGISDVLSNLVSNGVDACIYDTDTSKNWLVTVKTGLEAGRGSGETLLLEVTDNGTGMTDEVKAKLFRGLFSTKAGRGTGLGLLNTQKIIQEHGGEISVETQTGQGTTFSVRLKRKMPTPTG